jgi:hypothetical protein
MPHNGDLGHLQEPLQARALVRVQDPEEVLVNPLICGGDLAWLT